jgi:anti-sigma28 factor (negative regulator of flagellin synthesis)
VKVNRPNLSVSIPLDRPALRPRKDEDGQVAQYLDRVNLSSDVERLRDRAKAQRVETIRKEIANGTYEIDVDRLAEKFVEMELPTMQREMQ